MVDLRPYLAKILVPSKNIVNGTGFFCHPDGYILTCYHVIKPYLDDNRTEIDIRYQDKSFKAKIYEAYCLEKSDIAVLKIIGQNIQIKYLDLDIYKRWNINDNICSFGYPKGYFQKSGIGINASIGSPTQDKEGISIIQLTGLNIGENVNPGFSGAPVLHLKTKKVIGLVYARYKSKQAFFVPLKELFDSWSELEDLHDVFKKIRLKIAEKAEEELKKKLKGTEYIPLDLEYGEIPKRETEKIEDKPWKEWAHGREWKAFDLDKLFSLDISYILSSDVGSGKTTFFYWLARELVHRTGRAPIFITCAELEDIKNSDELKEYLVKKYKYLFKKEFLEIDLEYFLDKYLDEKKIVFLCDGLDQIKSYEYIKLTKKIFDMSRTNPVLISSRPTAVRAFETSPEITFLRLQAFSNEKQKEYFGSDDYEEARRISGLAPDLTRIPMLAYMVKVLIEKNKTGVVYTRTDVYERFINHIIYHQDSNIPISSQWDQLTKNTEKTLKCLAFKALDLKEPEIQKISDKLYDKINSALPLDDLPSFGLVNLIMERGDITKKYIYFTHQSFQEFLAAQYTNDNEGLIEKVLKEKWNPKWREVIKFLTGLRGEEIIEKIYPGSEEDNVIYSRLFLVAECIPEINRISERLKNAIADELWKLVYLKPFKSTAIKALGKLGDINKLKSLLLDKNSDVRGSAIEAIAQLKYRIDDEVIIQIAAMLKDEDWYVRGSAIRAIAELKDRIDDDAVSQIAAMLKDENSDVRSAVIDALASLNDRIDDEVISQIGAMLKDKNWDVRESTISALEQLKERLNDKAVSQIAAMLKDGYGYVRGYALRALGQLKERLNDKAVSQIAAMLKDEEGYVRRSALEALAQLKDRIDEEIISQIAAMLKDEDWFVRRYALEAVAQLKDRLNDEVISQIGARLKDEEAWVRSSALEALPQLKDRLNEEVISQIGAMLKDEDYDMRSLAIRALAKLKDRLNEEVISQIGARLKDEEGYVRKSALRALAQLKERIDEDVINQIAEMMKDRDEGESVRSSAIIALAELKDRLNEEVISQIRAMLKDEERYVRSSGIRALAKLKDRIDDEVISKIVDRLKDEDSDVRRSAIEALAQLQDRLDDKVISQIAARLKDEDEDVRDSGYNCLKILYESGKRLPSIKKR
jgi:HEAT repeat protein